MASLQNSEMFMLLSLAWVTWSDLSVGGAPLENVNTLLCVCSKRAWVRACACASVFVCVFSLSSLCSCVSVGSLSTSLPCITHAVLCFSLLSMVHSSLYISHHLRYFTHSLRSLTSGSFTSFLLISFRVHCPLPGVEITPLVLGHALLASNIFSI